MDGLRKASEGRALRRVELSAGSGTITGRSESSREMFCSHSKTCARARVTRTPQDGVQRGVADVAGWRAKEGTNRPRTGGKCWHAGPARSTRGGSCVAGKGRACGGRGRGVRAQNLARHGRIVLGHELVGLHVELGDLRGAVKVAQRLHVPELAGGRVRGGLARQDDFDVRDRPHERGRGRVPAPRRARGVGRLSGAWGGRCRRWGGGATGIQ